jgi:(1->4)-alpha-D-glucan 1-alpha-D-glucosylmutase
MGILVDIVPNHVGVATPRDNAWWWEVLKKGRDSQFAEAFDIDWDFGGGRVRLPVLTDESQLSLVDGELVCDGAHYPLAVGSADDGADPSTVLSRQHYELINWNTADTELNYRRFFAINSLAGIRVEVPWVFARSHIEITRWFREGLVDGLRVDHPDGLADPGGYLDDLARATDSAFVLVEKILEGNEQLPPHWQVAGTTGYDSLSEIDRVLVDPAGQFMLDRIANGSASSELPDWSSMVHDSKRAVADTILRTEILRVQRDLNITALSADAVADALAEVATCLPVYRTYLPFGAEHLKLALLDAHLRRPDLVGVLDHVGPALLDPENAGARRFQQTSGMIMAKGVEDSAFYRYSRLASLTEVGGDPDEFAMTVEEFHERKSRRAASFPASLTTLTTHDTKRSEDVRARINVLSEVADEWRTTLDSIRGMAPLGDASLENLLWETAVGAWPISRQRLQDYGLKAAREAGNSTSWTSPDAEFENRLEHVIASAFDDDELHRVVTEFASQITAPGWSNSLSAKLIQLTGPGIPDVYQGTELWETTLVDPDNRHEVDFDERRIALNKIDQGFRPPIDATGHAKLLVTSRALRLRRDRPGLFTRYAPLSAIGDKAAHVIAFDRGGAVTVGTRLPVGLERSGGWGTTELLLPMRDTVDLLTGRLFKGGSVPVQNLLETYPVALLAPAI